MAIHVHLPADINNTVLAKCILAPRVARLPVDELGVRVHGGPGTGRAVGKGDGQGRPSGDGGGDAWLDGVDPRACNAPDDEDQVFAAAVGEFVRVGPVGAEPGCAVGDGRVNARGKDAQGGEFGGVRVSESGGSFPVDVRPVEVRVFGKGSYST